MPASGTCCTVTGASSVTVSSAVWNALGLAGIGFIKENRRFYPKKEMAAHLIGYVGIDNVGLNGIESAYDAEIRGHAGTVLIQTDAKRKAFSRLERPPTAGATIELAIDEYLQHIVERELEAGVKANRADGGTAIIMDPHTGEILALANEPTFNPNTFRTSQDNQRRNRAVQDLYEPGSTFKIVTASAALEENVMKPTDTVDVSAGSIRFGSRSIGVVARIDHPFKIPSKQSAFDLDHRLASLLVIASSSSASSARRKRSSSGRQPSRLSSVASTWQSFRKSGRSVGRNIRETIPLWSFMRKTLNR